MSENLKQLNTFWLDGTILGDSEQISGTILQASTWGGGGEQQQQQRWGQQLR